MLMQIRNDGGGRAVFSPYPRCKQMKKHQLEEVEEGAVRELNRRNFLPQQFSTPNPQQQTQGRWKSLPLTGAKQTVPPPTPKLSLLVLLLCLKFLWSTVLAQSFENQGEDKNHIITLLNHASHIKQIIKFVCLSQSNWCKRAPKRHKFLFWGEAWKREKREDRNLFQGIREWEDRRSEWEPYIRREGSLK